jgi:SAM-dependent methyltransferase
MTEVFGKKLAEIYDLLYMDKPYKEECDFLETIFNKYAHGKVKTILDVGCGTGRHAIELGFRGYEVVGIDQSPWMIEIANKNLKHSHVSGVKFLISSIKDFYQFQEFDACIAMFNVAGYFVDERDLENMFKKVYDHLKFGGLFIFDFWNYQARTKYEKKIVKTAENSHCKVVRESNTSRRKDVFTINFKYKIFRDGGFDEFEETHKIKTLSRERLRRVLVTSGFHPLYFCKFLDMNGEVNREVWNVCAVSERLY